MSEATDTAVSASISTPVRSVVFTSALTSICGGSSIISTRTSIWVSARGWHSGMSSAVRLAAITPASSAALAKSPFFRFPALARASVSAETCTIPLAMADRSVSGFAVTSTIRALPLSSKCESSSDITAELYRTAFGVFSCTMIEHRLSFESRFLTVQAAQL